MKEIKSPKKPLIFYYGIVLLLIVLFNLIISPILMERQVMQVDYGTFMKMEELPEYPCYFLGKWILAWG